MKSRTIAVVRFTSLAAGTLLWAISATARAEVIFVGQWDGSKGTIGEYTTAGATISGSLITGLSAPSGIVESGGNLFVANYYTGTIGEYTTSGATVNASLITGLNGPAGIAASGGKLFVANYNNGTVGEYTTSGATVNASLITGLSGPQTIAASGGDLYVANYLSDTVGQYTTAGGTLNASLVGGLNGPEGIAVSGGNLFVSNVGHGSLNGTGTVGTYTVSGTPVNSSLITGLSAPDGLALSGGNLFVLNYGPSNAAGGTGWIGQYTTSGTAIHASLIGNLPLPQSFAVASDVPVPVALAGPTDPAYASGVYSTLGTGQTYTYGSYEIRPGATATLAVGDTLTLTNGPLRIDQGGLFIASGIINGDIINAGTIDVLARYTSSFTNTGTAVFQTPTSPPSAPSGAFDNLATVSFEPGSYSFDGFMNGAEGNFSAGGPGGGGGGIGGTVTINITPGHVFQNAGPVTIVGDLIGHGNYTQLATGQMIFHLDGTAFNEYSHSEWTGFANLEGRFTVKFDNGFVPKIGDTFDLFSATGGINLLPGWLGLLQEPGFAFNLMDNNTLFEATYTGVPEPSTLVLLGPGGGLGLLILGARRRLHVLATRLTN